MRKSIQAAALAAASALASAGPGGAEVVLINLFEVPKGQEENAIAAWTQARDFLKAEPGYVTAALHRALAPDARYALVNVARWESVEAFQAATARMQAAGAMPPVEGLGYTPGLYTVVQGDE